jgi:NAD-dependent SIR2 family protein deacetylase
VRGKEISYMACILCGKKKTTLTVKKRKKEINFCKQCVHTVQKATFVQDHPLVWVDKESLLNRYENDPESLKQIEALGPKDYADIADIMSDWFWVQNPEWWNYSLKEAFEAHLVDKEEEALTKMSKKDLPLMIGNIKHKKNEVLLEKLLKGTV